MGETDAAMVHEASTTAASSMQSLPAEMLARSYELFRLPADALFAIVGEHAPPLVRWSGFPGEFGDLTAPYVAALLWALAVIAVVVVYRAIRDAYVTACGYTRRFQEAWLRIGRNASRRSRLERKVAGSRRHTRGPDPTISEEIELGELEYAVLRCHADLIPGRGVTAAQVAESLDVRISQIRRALEVLSMLQLIVRVSRSSPGEDAFRLTPHGEGFLAACSGYAPSSVAA
ncbi:MAG TPA: helix-turn-helix domain-containing protein [Steroidobacteraceae bacterium]|nr:helix-turn-helix domain-containing protein [Steroidobacteraceae bacterium]